MPAALLSVVSHRHLIIGLQRSGPYSVHILCTYACLHKIVRICFGAHALGVPGPEPEQCGLPARMSGGDRRGWFRLGRDGVYGICTNTILALFGAV